MSSRAKEILDYVLTCLGEYRTEDEKYNEMVKEIDFLAGGLFEDE
jgi:hypothetical protein